MHRLQMLGHGAAAATDDPHAGIARQHRIFGHQRRRAVIVDVAVVILRDPGIALGDEGRTVFVRICQSVLPWVQSTCRTFVWLLPPP